MRNWNKSTIYSYLYQLPAPHFKSMLLGLSKNVDVPVSDPPKMHSILEDLTHLAIFWKSLSYVPPLPNHLREKEELHSSRELRWNLHLLCMWVWKNVNVIYVYILRERENADALICVIYKSYITKRCIKRLPRIINHISFI